MFNLFNACCQEQSQKHEELFVYQYDGLIKKRSVITHKTMNQHINNRKQHFQVYTKSQYDQIVQKCIKHQQLFSDSSFQIDIKAIQKINNRKITLNRMKNIASGALFSPESNQQIFTLRKNDSYFLASLKALSSSSENIRHVLDGVNMISEYGIYKLNISVNGRPKQVIIDDIFPVFQDNTKRLLFCKEQGGLLWVMLFQKTYAKLFGGYHKILQGNCHQIFNIFTLAPSLIHEVPLFLDQNNQQEVWTIISQSIKHKFPIACSSRNSKTCTGVISHKVYPILDCSISLQTSKRIIKLANVSTDLQSLEKDCIQYEKNGELLNVQLTQFIRNFQSIDVAHIRNNYNSYFYSFKSSQDHLTFYKFQLSENTDFYLTFQKANNNKGRVKIILCKVIYNQDHVYEYIAGKMEQNFSDITLRLKSLQKGSYVVLCQSSIQSECFLRVYCQTALVLEEFKQGYKFLEHMFYGMALKNKKERQVVGKNTNDWIYTKEMFQQIGLGFMIVSLSKYSEYRCVIEFNGNQQGKFQLINKKEKMFRRELGLSDIQILIFELIDINEQFCSFPPESLLLKKIL